MTSTTQSTKATPTSSASFVVIGNVGKDPKEITFDAKQEVISVYDPVTEGPVEKLIDIPARSIWVFSVAVNGKDASGEPVTSWVDVYDEQGLTNRFRKGDYVEMSGYQRIRKGVDKKTGEPRTYKNFIPQQAKIIRMKMREQAA